MGEEHDTTAEYESDRHAIAASSMKNYLIAIVVLCLAWAVFAIYNGIDLVYNIDSMIDQLKSQEIWETIMQYMTEEDVRNLLASMGYVIIASGILAMISGILTAFKKSYTGALIACVLSSILGLIMILGVFGFAVVYLITKAKDAYS